ncbi:MAG: hypothetical protein ACYDAY_02975 [Candidatus Dormibacteria bacterium]
MSGAQAGLPSNSVPYVAADGSAQWSTTACAQFTAQHVAVPQQVLLPDTSGGCLIPDGATYGTFAVLQEGNVIPLRGSLHFLYYYLSCVRVPCTAGVTEGTPVDMKTVAPNELLATNVPIPGGALAVSIMVVPADGGCPRAAVRSADRPTPLTDEPCASAGVVQAYL